MLCRRAYIVMRRPDPHIHTSFQLLGLIVHSYRYGASDGNRVAGDCRRGLVNGGEVRGHF